MQKEMYIGLLVGLIISSAGFLGFIVYDEFLKDEDSKEWTDEFNIEDRTLSTTGNNTFFILQVGYQLILEDGDKLRLEITVLNETKTIGGIETRVLEEREIINGELYEISRNYFAIDTDTSCVFYFGEEVDYYENGEIVGHEGAWEAYSDDAKPGLIMPGIFLLGSRYYQEVAPGAAEDRAEIVSLDETFETDAGTFTNCLKTEETNPLESGKKEYKYYAPGIGLIYDEDAVLVSYGFI